MRPGFIERSFFLFSVLITLAAVWMLMPSGAIIRPESAAISVVGAWFITVLAHEAGHVVAGQLAGFRLLEMAVGPIRVHWTGDRFHLGLNRRNPLAGYSVSLPVAGDRITRRLALTTLGGPAGNLILAIIAWLLLLALTGGHPHKIATSDAEYFLATVAIFSTIYVPANLLPFRASARGFVPDGRQIITYLRRTPGRQREEALALLHADDQILSTLPETWDGQTIERALSYRDGSESDMSALFFAYLHARDGGRPAEAERYLDELVAWRDRHREAHWVGPYVHKAIWEATNGSPAEAHVWRTRAGARADAGDRHAMAGAAFLAAGQIEAARRELEEALQDTHRHMARAGASGSMRSHERWLLQMLQKCEPRRAESASRYQ